MRLKGYTVLQDWMLDEPSLDIYETLALAIIYGFSQDGESSYAGSQAYLARKLKCSKRKVANALAHLVELDLVEKIDKTIQGVKLCEYRYKGIEAESVEAFERTFPEKLGKVFRKPTVEEVAEYCRERGNGINAERFVAKYEANGWKVGKNQMKDWRATVRYWETLRSERNGITTSNIKGDRNGVVEEDFPTTL